MKTALRRAKIIATLGPSTDDKDVLTRMLSQGLNLVRVNFSHGSIDSQIQRIHKVLSISNQLNRPVGVLADLQGPKIRIKKFQSGKIVLKEGAQFILDAAFKGLGDQKRVGLDYPALADDVEPDDILLLDDGRVTLKVCQVLQSQVVTQVIEGGELSDHKGLNKKGGGLSADALTERDFEVMKALKAVPIDYIAFSFVKTAEDVQLGRQWMMQLDLKAGVIAKIERIEAVECVEAIIKSSDAVMVARGDLGVEMGYAQLPGIQKDIIRSAQALDKCVITATQMMESMVENTLPTRAEVSDVANAILEGTDAVMLSAETAVGRHPVRVIQRMHEICLAAEERKGAQRSHHRVHTQFARHDEAIAMAAMYVANHLEVKAIVALTESGSTPLWMSRIRSSIPIYALSRHPSTCGRMTLLRGVYPVLFDLTDYEPWQVTRYALSNLVQKGILSAGDKVIVTKGNIMGVGGKANNLKIVTAESLE